MGTAQIYVSDESYFNFRKLDKKEKTKIQKQTRAFWESLVKGYEE